MERRADPREHARRRLRATFLAEAAARVAELGHVAGGELDAATGESAAQAFERMGKTAESLDLAALAGAAGGAAAALQAGGGLAEVRRVAREIRAASGPPRFGVVEIVGAAGASAALREAGQLACEPVRLWDAPEALLAEIRGEAPQAVVVPVGRIDVVPSIVDELDCPVYAYGDPSDLARRRAAAAAGIEGWIDLPLDLPRLLDRVRRGTWRRLAPAARLLVAMAPGDLRAALVDALSGRDFEVVTVDDPHELIARASLLCPDLLVVAELPGFDATEALRVLRAHPTLEDTPIIALGVDAKAGLQAGADTVIAASSAPGAIARTVRYRLERVRGRDRALDPVTGLLVRPAALAAVDREMARARRWQRAMSAAVIEVDGLERATDPDRALRLFATCLREGLRAYDITGRLGGNAFVAVLAECTAEPAQNRIQALLDRFRAACDADVVTVAGVADSDPHAASDLLVRADAALVRARSRGDGSRVGM